MLLEISEDFFNHQTQREITFQSWIIFLFISSSTNKSWKWWQLQSEPIKYKYKYNKHNVLI